MVTLFKNTFRVYKMFQNKINALLMCIIKTTLLVTFKLNECALYGKMFFHLSIYITSLKYKSNRDTKSFDNLPTLSNEEFLLCASTNTSALGSVR